MEVSRDSWHYRYLTFLHWTHPRTLCPYFWKVVWALVIAGAVPVLLLSLAGTLLWYHIWAPFYILGAFVVVVLFWLGIAWLAMYLEDVRPWQKITKSDNLTVEFLRAKKNKLCPTLTFK